MRARFAPSARRRAARAARAARSPSCCSSWGGATIAYRKRLIDSPSYTLNHEEVEKALEEGIRFAEGLTPLAIEVDEAGHAIGLTVSVQRSRRRRTVGREGAHAVARAHDPRRGRHAAQHRARARGRGALRARRALLRACATRTARSPSRARGLAKPARAGRADATSPPTAARRASSATCIRRSSATWSRRWRARSRAIRSCRECSRA